MKTTGGKAAADDDGYRDGADSDHDDDVDADDDNGGDEDGEVAIMHGALMVSLVTRLPRARARQPPDLTANKVGRRHFLFFLQV